jgi:hypothetical protein
MAVVYLDQDVCELAVKDPEVPADGVSAQRVGTLALKLA